MGIASRVLGSGFVLAIIIVIASVLVESEGTAAQQVSSPQTFEEADCGDGLHAEALERWPGGSYILDDSQGAPKPSDDPAFDAALQDDTVRVGYDSDEEAALEMASSELGGDAMRRWPETFAGTWGEQPESDRLYIAFTEGATEKVEQLAADHPCPDLIEAETFEHSFRELEARMAEMRADRDRAHEGELVLPGVPEGRFDMELDESRNAIVVTLPDAAQAADTFHTRYGDEVIVEEGEIMVPE